MRQNLIIALLAVCCTLLAVNVYVTLQRPQLPVAFGQANGSDVLIAASNGQNDAFVFLYNRSMEKLISYKNKGGGSSGLELMGIRHCGNDWNPKIKELPHSNRPTAVRKMRQLADEIAKKAKKAKKSR